MILDSVNRSVVCKLAVAIATEQSSFVAAWADLSKHDTVPGCTRGLTNGVTSVTVTGAPAVNVQRILKEIIFHNRDSQNTSVIFLYKDSANEFELVRAVLLPGQTLTYGDKAGWTIAPISSGFLAKRTATITTDGTPTVDYDNVDVFVVTALASDITSMTVNSIGSPTAGQELWVEITDDGTPRNIVWGSDYEDSAEVIMPTRTSPGFACRTLFSYNMSTNKFQPLWTYGGLSSINTLNLVYDGDSFTHGDYVTFPYPTLVVPTDGLTYTTANVAVGGSTTAQSRLRAAANVDRLYKPDSARNVCVFWSGQNDGFFGATALTAFLDIVAYCRARQVRGWKVVVVTMPSRNGLDVFKNALNVYLRANWPSFADAIADVAAVPVLGNDGAYSNSTYFLTSGLGIGHFTDLATQIAADVVEIAILQTWLANGAVNRSRFKAIKNGTDQTGIASATFTKVTFPTISGDNIGVHYDTTLSRWKPPYGPVAINARILCSVGIVDGSLGVLSVYKNGAAFGGSDGITVANGTAFWPISTYVEDVASGADYYEAWVYLAGAGTKTISGTLQYTCFSGFSK